MLVSRNNHGRIWSVIAACGEIAGCSEETVRNTRRAKNDVVHNHSVSRALRPTKSQLLSQTTVMPPSKPHKPHVPKPPDAAPQTISAIVGLVAISLVLFVYQRALIPIYATGPTTYLLNPVLAAAMLLAALHPVNISTSTNWLYTALVLAAAPKATYWVSVWTSRKKDPVWGPLITHATVLAPMIFLLTTSVAKAQLTWAQRKMHVDCPSLVHRVVAAGVCFVVGNGLSQRFWANHASLNNISESQIFLGLAALSWCLWIYNHPIRPAAKSSKNGKHEVVSHTQNKAIFIAASLALLGTTYPFLTSPVLPHPLPAPYTRPKSSIIIHSAVQSVTGLIVVGEALSPADHDGSDDEEMHSVRYLRASHSILGGVWMGSKVMILDHAEPFKDSLGAPLGDSIYSTFVLQEAVRLVNSTARGKNAHWDNALIIGLGAGTSASAFIRNKVPLTIVEIDPAVYNAAKTYFGLPDPGPGKVFLEDARGWVERARANTEAGKKEETRYDFVVHDCFSGGGVPQHIFTTEFWEGLKTILQPEAVVAINFAGIPKSDSTRMVLATLEKSFVSCHAFHDMFSLIRDDQYDTEFINIVFFCTTSESPLTFRESTKADWLGSPLRRHVMGSLGQRELHLDFIRHPSNEEENSKYVLTDAHNPLGKLQDAQGLHHWKLMREGFEWVVRDVHKLRDLVEGVDVPDTENTDFEILKQSPMLGDNKFKLEIAFTPTAQSTSKPTLSLYITSLMVDFAHADYELSASMMTAIKCSADRVGERGAPSEWVWDFWQMDWVFRHEHEVWECPLPPLSALLENARIRETDSFVICVQIHCPFGPSYPQQPAVHTVPKDLLDGLEASLDNSNTGDVRFICLERQTQPPDTTTPTSRRPSSSASSYSPFSSRTTARKRVIYAHSDILVRRSEYFATMLASSFSENPAFSNSERKIYTIIVEEAEFETIYWLLKFCYTNWLLFREEDDPRMAMDGVGVGWSAKWLHSRGGEWDWKTFQRDDSATNDTRSVTSGDSLPSVVDGAASSNKAENLQPGVHTNVASPASAGSSGSRNLSVKSMPQTSSSPRPMTTPRRTTPSSNTPTSPNIPSGSRTKPVPIPVTTTGFNSSARSGYPISPRVGRQHPLTPVSSPDPHPHPTPAPRPASALSMYQVAHRYAMPSLATLALEHMMSTITPQSSFALLLASSVWDELHSLVEDYVVEKWDEVSVSQEFEQCCQEVAAGEQDNPASPLSPATMWNMKAYRQLTRPIPQYVTKRLLATAAHNTKSFIPVIDFTQFREAAGQPERKRVAEKIVSAFRESGFIYLTGHGIAPSTIQNAFTKSTEFFAMPPTVKDELSWEDPRSNRGYVTVGRERVTQSADPTEIAALRAKAPDCKESMEIGRDWDAQWKNQWPQESDAPKFKSTMLDFYQTCHDLHVYVMRSIALGLDLEEGFFDNKIDEQCHNLRLLSYPPIKTALLQNDGQARAGSHSGADETIADYGILTLLFQDSEQVGGLEVKNPHTGDFIPATPIVGDYDQLYRSLLIARLQPGTIVVNVGDLLARWSNDVLRSTLHRVVAPPAKQISDTEGITPLRQSIAFFCNPNFSAEVACLPNCGDEAKYPPVKTEEYIVGRLAVTYS
ncbi:hypothetical protein C0991_003554 [Blastosporella zonata]|nr:hypothetical protein C0991_003554 [Blastosporella zonata]